MQRLNYPNGFNAEGFPPDLAVFWDGRYACNLARYADLPGAVAYVDAVTGDDAAGTGSVTQPWRSVLKAYKAGAGTIYLAPGDYRRAEWLDLYRVERSVAILRWPGRAGDVRLIAAQELTWSTPETLTGGVWLAARSNVTAVLDGGRVDANGDILRLPQVADRAACALLPGSWYTAGGAVGVHLLDDAIPDALTWAVIAHNLWIRGPVTVYLRGLTFIGGDTPVRVEATAGGAPTLVAQDCQFIQGNTNGLTATGADVLLERCQAVANGFDGFNYHQGGLALELACVGARNGRKTAGADQGSTQHETGRVVRVGGVYTDNRCEGIADVNAAQAWNVACLTAGNGIAGIMARGAGVRAWCHHCACAETPALWVDEGAVALYTPPGISTYTTSGGLAMEVRE